MDLGTVLLVVGVSAAPFAELRGGIPLALSQGFTPAAAFLLAVLGNIAVVPILLLGLEVGEALLARWPFTRRILEWVFTRTRRKGRLIERWGPPALILLVAIPLPGTGAWTGALAARLFGIPLRKALPWIVIGVLIAGGVVLAASLGAFHLIGVS
jgi:uncharacterized membrane protein